MTHRIEQAESLMHRAVTQVIQRNLSDPRIAGVVSVTRIHITPDMRRADVFVSVLPEKYEKRTIAGLTAAATHIHHKVKKLVALRTVPHLEYKLDASVKKQAAVEQAIQEGMARSGPAEPDDPPPTDRPDA